MQSFINKIKRGTKKFLTSYRILPRKKHYLEFLAVVLSIPMFLTIILVNYNNLKSSKENEQIPSTNILERIIEKPATSNSNETPDNQSDKLSLTDAPCIEEVGPVDISSPEEGEKITESPVFVEIDEGGKDYCASVWSYRINKGKWSSYDDRSVALYDLPSGDVILDLRVKSTVTGEQITLTRKFSYNPAGSDIQPSPKPTP